MKQTHKTLSNSRRVVITGMGVMTAVGSGVDEFLTALQWGTCGIGTLDGLDEDQHHSTLGAIIPDLLSFQSKYGTGRLDRGSLLALLACDEAITNAQLTEQLTGQLAKQQDKQLRESDPPGVILGTTLGGMNSGLEFYQQYIKGSCGKVGQLAEFPLHTANDHLASRWNLFGPNMVLSTACAAGTHAIGMGSELIRWGEADMVITGGYDPFCKLTHAGFGVMGLLSRDTLRPFDKNRSGLVLGEGAGILVLESEDHAQKRGASILAEISGFGITNDAHHLTAPEADGKGAARAIEQALQQAKLTPADIGYINAHGTGTKKNDSAETWAIKRVFGEHTGSIPISSTKSMIGHTLGAAGAIELIATLLAMNNDFVPPTINLQTIDPQCDLHHVANTPRQHVFDAALSNSFGFGGNNGCLVVKKYSNA